MFLGKLFGKKGNVLTGVDIDHTVPKENLSGVEFLTDKGWVPMEMLVPAAKVVSALDGESYAVTGVYGA